MLRTILAAICLTMTATFADATEPPNPLSTVAELGWMCAGSGATSEEARDRSALICWGYMRGVMGAYAELHSEATTQRICLPEGIDDLRLANTFMAWASHQRESLSLPAARGVYIALGEAFPCRQD